MLPDWEKDALLEEVVVAPRAAFVRLPDMQVIERPGWLQLITPSFTRGGFNEVAQSVLSPDEADAVIDATLAEYRRLGLRFRWSVTPDSRPVDLAERLARRGLSCTLVQGMARATHPATFPAPNELVTVEEVDERQLDTFTRLTAQGWDNDRASLDIAHEAIFRQPERPQRFYLASYKGEPAGVASYVAFPRSAYLLGAVVLPPYRRHGLYQALVSARLADAAARGLLLATSHAQDKTSAPLLARMGFETLCSFSVFHG